MTSGELVNAKARRDKIILGILSLQLCGLKPNIPPANAGHAAGEAADLVWAIFGPQIKGRHRTTRKLCAKHSPPRA